ncbi:MAG: PfkB family carbohydrate kinase, partial [Lysinibacillus sp.]
MKHKDNEFILVYGDAFIDYIADDISNTSFTKFMGGATVNVAAGISRIGAPSVLITITGDDEASQFVRDGLDTEGVNLDYAVIDAAKRVSGVYV